MRTLAGRMQEPLWLLAIVAVPLAGPSEAGKAWVARLLAVALLGCWLVDRTPARPLPRSVAIGLGLLVLSMVASVAGTVAPWASLLGEDVRGQGLLTFCAYAVLFVVIATTATRRQVARAVLWMLAAGLAVLTYWLLQHGGLDPFGWADDGALASSLGDTSFLRDYLTMLAALVCAMAGRWALVALAAVGVLFVASTVMYRPRSIEYRLALWQAVPAVIQARPWTGYGPETELLMLLDGPHRAVVAFEGKFSQGGYFQDRTENLELDALLERGAFGLVGLLAFFGAVLWRGWHRSAVFAVPLLALLVDAQVGVMSTTSQFYAFVLAGLIVAASCEFSPKESRTWPPILESSRSLSRTRSLPMRCTT